jgi:hypothetical protein
MKKKQLPLLIFCEEQLASGINIALLSFVLLLYSYPLFFCVCPITRTVCFCELLYKLNISLLYRRHCILEMLHCAVYVYDNGYNNNYEEETAPSTDILWRTARIRNQYCTSEFFVLLLYSYPCLCLCVRVRVRVRVRPITRTNCFCELLYKL